MATIANLVVNLSLNDNSFRSKLQSSRDNLDKWGASLRGLGTKFTAGVTMPILAAGGTFSKWAANLEQTVGATEHLWGDNANAIMAWAEAADKSMGMSVDEALTTANRLNGIYRGMGLTMDETQVKTEEMGERFADLSALMGGSPVEAAEAYTSALMGNYNALDKYNININAAMVEQRALTMTGKESTAQLSLEEKQLAFNALYLEKTADAQGQFHRELHTTSGRLAVNTARAKNAANTFGKLLLPYVNRLLEVFSKMVDWVEKLSDKQRTWVIGIAAVAAAIGPVLIVIGMLLPGLSALLAVIGFLVSPIGAVVLGVGLLAAGLIYAYTHFEGFREIVDKVASTIKDVLIGAFDMAVEAFNKLKDAFKADGWTGLIFTLGEMIWNGLSHVFNAIRNIDWGSLVRGGWNIISAGISKAWDMITSLDWDSYIQPITWAKWIGGKIVDIAVWLWGKIKDHFPSTDTIVGTIDSVATWVWDKISKYFPSANVVRGVITSVADFVWGKIKDWFPSAAVILGNILDFGTWLYEKIGSPELEFPTLQWFKDTFLGWLGKSPESDFGGGGNNGGGGGGGAGSFDFGMPNFTGKGSHIQSQLDRVVDFAKSINTTWANIVRDSGQHATQVENRTNSMVSSMGQMLSRMATDAVSRFTSMHSETTRRVTEIEHAVASAFTAMRSIVSQHVSAMVSAAQNGGQGMRDGLTRWIPDVTSRISSALQSIVNMVRNVAGRGYDAGHYAGSQISRGFVDGMLRYLDLIRNTAAQMVFAAESAVRAKAMISSPSRLFRGLGENVSEGFEAGIRSGIPDAALAASDLVTVPQLTGGGASGGASGGEVKQYFFALTSAEFSALLEKAENGDSFARGFAGELSMSEGVA